MKLTDKEFYSLSAAATGAVGGKPDLLPDTQATRLTAASPVSGRLSADRLYQSQSSINGNMDSRR